MPVHDHDADGPRRIHGVLTEHWIGVDRPQRTYTDAVIERRYRRDRDVVDHVLYARHVRDLAQGFIATHARPILTFNRDLSVLHSGGEVIEGAVVAGKNVRLGGRRII